MLSAFFLALLGLSQIFLGMWILHLPAPKERSMLKARVKRVQRQKRRELG